MNADQKRYINSLSYKHTGNTDLDRPLTDSIKEDLARSKTIEELVSVIKKANCFGLKDSIIIEFLG